MNVRSVIDIRKLFIFPASLAIGVSSVSLVLAQAGASAGGQPPAHDREAVRAANFACSRELETNPDRGLVLCRQALRLAETIPNKTLGTATDSDYENAWRAYVSGVIAVGRSQEDVDALREGLPNRAKIGRGEDKVAAAAHFALAMVLQRLGRNQEAESEFTAADAMNAKIAGDPSLVSKGFTEDQRFMLQQHAAYRRALGDAAGARSLEAKAAALVVPAPVRLVLTSRRVRDITVVESRIATVTADDIEAIESTVAGVWWIATGLDESSKLTVDACGLPDVVAGVVRRGRCWRLAKSDAAGQKGNWTRGDQSREYVQIIGGESPRPMNTIGKFSDSELTSLVSFLRGQAVPSSTSRPSVDVQPWPVDMVMRSGTDVRVTLLKEDGTQFQSIVARRQGDGWTIVDMR